MQLKEKGSSVREIAKELGVSKSRVGRWFKEGEGNNIPDIGTGQ